jgi:hypothetical protein
MVTEKKKVPRWYLLMPFLNWVTLFQWILGEVDFE